MSNPGGRQDPLTAFCFSLQIAGIVEAGEAFFKSVSGLKSESEVVPYREGGLNSHTHQLVGAIKWPNLVLKRGFVAKTGYKLLEWRQTWVRDDPRVQLKRLSGKIIQLDSQMQEVCSWVFYDGWPCKWEGPDYDASKTELAIETVEIAHSGLFFQPGASRSGPSAPRTAGQPAPGQQPGVGKPPKQTDAERQEMLDSLDGGSPPPKQPGVGKPPKMTDAERQEMLDNLDGGPPAQQPGVGKPPSSPTPSASSSTTISRTHRDRPARASPPTCPTPSASSSTTTSRTRPTSRRRQAPRPDRRGAPEAPRRPRVSES